MPFWDSKKDELEQLKEKVEEQEGSIRGINESLSDQRSDLQDIKTKLDEISQILSNNEAALKTEKYERSRIKEEMTLEKARTSDQLECLENDSRDLLNSVGQLKDDTDSLRGSLDTVIEKGNKTEIHLENIETNIGNIENSFKTECLAISKRVEENKEAVTRTILDLKGETEISVSRLQVEMDIIRTTVNEGVEKIEEVSTMVESKVERIENLVESLKEDIWELDSSNRNNVLFYGVKEEPGQSTEAAIREIIRRQLNLGRDIPIARVKKGQGAAVRGTQPITVCLQKYQDKMAILRKSKLLRGTNIMVSEDYPKRVQEQRAELTKFAKEVRKQNPEARISLQYDKLYIDSDPYIFSEETGRVEILNEEVMVSSRSAVSRKSAYSRVSTPARRRMRKSYSTESDLHLPVSPSKSAKKNMEDDLSDNIDFDDDFNM